MKDIQGKKAVVTGGGSGIGRGIAHALADGGMDVVVADIEPAAAERVAAELSDKGVRAIGVEVDVADADAVRDLADLSFGELGAVDVLCNNAGVCLFKPTYECTAEDWAWTLDVDLRGVVNGLVAFLPRMRTQHGEKHIVNTASMMAVVPLRLLGAYGAAKHGVIGLSEVLRWELEGAGFGVSVLCPGAIETQIGNSGRNRQGRYGLHVQATAEEQASWLREIPGCEDSQTTIMALSRTHALEFGRTVREAIVNNWLYVFTPGPDIDHWIAETQSRHDLIMHALLGAKQAHERASERRP